jgi:histidinol phosphatase-like PHP family hydrolase
LFCFFFHVDIISKYKFENTEKDLTFPVSTIKRRRFRHPTGNLRRPERPSRPKARGKLWYNRNDMKTIIAIAASALASLTLMSDELRNGSSFSIETVPSLLTAKSPPKTPVRFTLEENVPAGCVWRIENNKNESTIKTERRASANGTRLYVEAASHVQTPARVEFKYVDPSQDDKCIKSMRFLLYTASGQQESPVYPRDATFGLLKKECEKRGIVITDWHIHIRGGMTPELAAKRELESGIRSSAMENHGREWEIFDNSKLVDFAKNAKKIDVCGRKMPVGIQVNDRDWFRQIDEKTRAEFDYILADTMIMGKLPDGRDNRLWLVKEIADADKWMEEYMEHNLRILDEPIDILANPTYLPLPLAHEYDRLWTEERMRKIIAKAVEKGIALEIQATSPYPRPKFLKLAKEMGAKFSFGTNNFDPRPKDLSKWLEAIVWLDLKAGDIWTPKYRKSAAQPSRATKNR